MLLFVSSIQFNLQRELINELGVSPASTQELQNVIFEWKCKETVTCKSEDQRGYRSNWREIFIFGDDGGPGPATARGAVGFGFGFGFYLRSLFQINKPDMRLLN